MLISVVYISCSKITDNLVFIADEANNKQQFRSIERIDILKKLLMNNKHFSSVLLKHIARLQRERENELSTQSLNKSWIFNEVSKLSNVIKYGTLKNSFRNYMETRISHLFTGLISICDTNNNLDLLVNSAEKQWVSDLWIKMLDDEQLVNISYAKYYLQAKNFKEKTEFLCLSYRNLMQNKRINSKLCLKLPFSWLIKENLDNLNNLKIRENDFVSKNFNELESLRNSIDANGRFDNSKFLYEQVVNVFVNSEFYKKLNSLISD